MRKLFKWVLLGICMMFVLQVKMQVQAEESNQVSVTVPATIGIVFEKDGSNSVQEFSIRNQSAVPVHFSTLQIEEYNDWRLVEEQTEIPADTKQLVMKMENQYLHSGENAFAISIPENSQRTIQFEIQRGAWTYSAEAERALVFQTEYEIGKKEFEINFDGNESDTPVSAIRACNGDGVVLPTPVRAKYQFLGWQDQSGNMHSGKYVMPIGNVTLKAVWQWTDAYALYCASDRSLTFMRAANEIAVGSIYDGKTVTAVYKGFENAAYYAQEAPWQEYRNQVRTIEVRDVIQPTSTAYWFFCMEYVEQLELEKLDMSQVKDITSMFSDTGYYVTGTFELNGIGKWDTSNIEQMGTAFRGTGRAAKEFIMDDISCWDTSAAVDMWLMFASTGYSATWTLDCSNWNVSNVTNYENFNYYSESKVVPPQWVN